jgi:hypothetical protein
MTQLSMNNDTNKKADKVYSLERFTIVYNILLNCSASDNNPSNTDRLSLLCITFASSNNSIQYLDSLASL